MKNMYYYYPTFEPIIKNDFVVFLDCVCCGRIYVKTRRDEKLSSILNKYMDLPNHNKDNCKFLFNGDILDDPNKTFGDYGIKQYSVITITKTNQVSGGGGFCSYNFTDLSKKKCIEYPISKTAPIYRYIIKGINIYGICKTEKCIAYNKEVICPLKGIKRFNLIRAWELEMSFL